MMRDIGTARGQERLATWLRGSVRNSRLLIIDEFGYLPLEKSQAHDLFRVVSKLDEYGSVIITRNLDFGQRDQTLRGDSALAAALLDRLLHLAQVILLRAVVKPAV